MAQLQAQLPVAPKCAETAGVVRVAPTKDPRLHLVLEAVTATLVAGAWFSAKADFAPAFLTRGE